MKAFTNPAAHPRGRLASSFSLTEKSVIPEDDHDEHSQTDILT
jgi:hypothetical protein